MKRGFTLIELIVVIAIIAILAAIVAPNAFKAIEKGKISATIGDYKSINTSAMAYYSDTGQWPANGVTTAGFVTTDAVAGWDGPYLEKWPARANWSGVYGWVRGADSAAVVGGFNWDGAATTPDVRCVSVTLVPLVAAGKIDVQLDGVAGVAAGSIRYDASAATTTEYILISND